MDRSYTSVHPRRQRDASTERMSAYSVASPEGSTWGTTVLALCRPMRIVALLLFAGSLASLLIPRPFVLPCKLPKSINCCRVTPSRFVKTALRGAKRLPSESEVAWNRNELDGAVVGRHLCKAPETRLLKIRIRQNVSAFGTRPKDAESSRQN